MACRPQRVLLVDDVAELRAVWTEWLQRWGFAVSEADCGATAVAKAIEWRPALVIMDLTMPVMSGLNATRLLKDDPRTAAIPVLALSADVLPPTPQDSVEAGCLEFIPKPATAQELLSAIRRAFRHVRQRQAQRRTEQSGALAR